MERPHVSIAAIVLTRNEAHNVKGVVDSLRRVTPHVVIIDSDSDDDTRGIAEANGCIAWQHSFEGYPAQRNWALDKVRQRLDPDWILIIDADERLSDELVEELAKVSNEDSFDAYRIPIRLQFCGKVLRFGGFSRTRLLRVFRADVGSYEARDVNEHLTLRCDARVGEMSGPIMHNDVVSWERHIDKHNMYSTLEAEVRYRRRLNGTRPMGVKEALKKRHLRRRWLREAIWDKARVRPVLRFAQTYLLSGGLFDGRAGFRMALLQAWQEMCIDVKYEELIAKEREDLAGSG